MTHQITPAQQGQLPLPTFANVRDSLFFCQFRDVGKSYFKTDCTFPTRQQAINYCLKVINTLADVAEARVVLYGGQQVWPKGGAS